MKLSRQEMPDLFARAVIASARVYGDDPVLAMVGTDRLGNTARRSLNAAGEAVRQKLNWPRASIARCLNLQPASFKAAAMKREGRFPAALTEARGTIDLFIKALPPLGYPPLVAVETGGQAPPGLVSPASDPAKVVIVRTDPPVAVRTGKPVVANRPVAAPHKDGSLGDRIYAEILTRPLSANSLATILDVKEMNVINSLRALALEGAIVSVTGGNESSQKWHAA